MKISRPAWLQYILNIARVVIFIVVMYYFLSKVELHLIYSQLSSANIYYIVIALVLYFLKYVIQGLRWYNASNAHGGSTPCYNFIQDQIEISFLEMVFPVPDSEDALRIVKMKSNNTSLTQATAIALYDRVIGFMFLLIMVPICIDTYTIVSVNIGASYLYISAFLLFVIGIFYRFIALKFIKLLHKSSLKKFINLNEVIIELSRPISLYHNIIAVILVLLYGITTIMSAYVLMNGLVTEVSFFSLFAGIPILYLSQIVPVSYQGLGLLEASLVYILQSLNIPMETAMTAGLIHFTFHVLIILFGGIIFLLKTFKK